MYRFIIRNCRCFNNIQTLTVIYFAYVRSQLEYGSLIWNPYYNCHRMSIESVQRKFLKFLSFKLDGVYLKEELVMTH